MMKNWLKLWNVVAASVLVIAIGGCAGTAERPIKIVSEPLKRAPLALEAPKPLAFSPLIWRVVTPENASAVWAEMQASDQKMLLIALTLEGYQQLMLDQEEIRSFVSNQRFIILRYQDYYEPKTTPKNKK
jgi:hypothetical protein